MLRSLKINSSFQKYLVSIYLVLFEYLKTIIAYILGLILRFACAKLTNSQILQLLMLA